MKLSEMTAAEQGQLALAVAEILTDGMTTAAEVDALLCTLAALRDNVHLYALKIKKSAQSRVSDGQSYVSK